MTTASEYVATIQAQQRAVRHATSLPLAVNALAMLFLTYAEATMQRHLPVTVLVPALTYALLLLAMLIRRRVSGVGVGNDRYGLLALALLALLFVPFGLVGLFLIGPAFFLGLGLVVLGCRGSDPRLWGPGLFLMALSPLVSLGTLSNHAAFLGGGVGCMAIATIGLITLATATFVRERRVSGATTA